MPGGLILCTYYQSPIVAFSRTLESRVLASDIESYTFNICLSISLMYDNLRFPGAVAFILGIIYLQITVWFEALSELA